VLLGGREERNVVESTREHVGNLLPGLFGFSGERLELFIKLMERLGESLS
jgi:hypothetical protein